MAKNKHELLAKSIKEILDNHSDFSKKVFNTLQLVQMHFYEPLLLLGRPNPTNEFLSMITKSHLLGLINLSPFHEIKKKCKEIPVFGAIIKKPFYLKSEVFQSREGKWIIPWKTKVIIPESQEEETKEQLLNMLLYCPDKSEFSNEIDWFEEEDCSDFLHYQLNEIFKENYSKNLIRKNLNQLAKPFYSNIVNEWRNEPDKAKSDIISNNDITINAVSFAPNINDNIAYAYEKVLKRLKTRKNKSYYNLMLMWKKYLEEIIFINVPYSKKQKESFLRQWKENLFKKNYKKSANNERWEQGQTIDRSTAVKIILYFANQFIKDPNNNKTEGELTCFLWILIWLSYELKSTNISLSEVLKLKTDNLKDHLEISYKNHTIEISYGLYQLLTILKGSGKGNRSHYLFPNLVSKSRKHLENLFKKASSELFGNNKIFIVSPSAFCSFPHSLKGIRITKKERTIQQTTVVQDNFLLASRNDIKKMLKQKNK